MVGANTVSSPAITPSPPATQTQATAQQILLAAASHAERAPATSGRYWHVKSIENRIYLVPAGYHVTSPAVEELWTAARSGDSSWSGRLQQAARPSTPADEQAWRADGSPTGWRILGNRLSTRSQKPKLTRLIGPSTYLGENEVSRAELEQLPTDPNKLHAWLEKRVKAQGGIPSDAVLQSQVFDTVVQLLAATPASPALRAAALRVLAAMPYVHSAGAGKDDRGRTGVRIVFDSGSALGYAGEMIINPDGPAVLQINQKVDSGAKMIQEIDTLILTAEWTNNKPQPPTAP